MTDNPEKHQFQYLLTCPECGGVSNSYSERILHPAEIEKLEAELRQGCALCYMIRAMEKKQ
jgi:hypothetical protein